MPDRDEPSLRVSLPPKAQHLTMVRRLLGNFARHLGMGERAIGDLKTVVSEACAVAVAGDAGAQGRAVRVEARRDGPDLAVAVRDQGSGLRTLDAANGDGPGLGLKLIAALSRFEISEAPEGGTVVSMRLPLS
jgi:anti-sigma regulatory factor (Ser/Thr protein kinase)